VHAGLQVGLQAVSFAADKRNVLLFRDPLAIWDPTMSKLDPNCHGDGSSWSCHRSIRPKIDKLLSAQDGFAIWSPAPARASFELKGPTDRMTASFGGLVIRCIRCVEGSRGFECSHKLREPTSAFCLYSQLACASNRQADISLKRGFWPRRFGEPVDAV
jgi:hypothetical protein